MVWLFARRGLAAWHFFFGFRLEMSESKFDRIRSVLQGMIIECQAWEDQHRRANRKIEVLACKIRLKGLLELEGHIERIAKDVETFRGE